nr:MAG TPA: hypothetical protein [Caudoviricetes sp.]
MVNNHVRTSYKIIYIYISFSGIFWALKVKLFSC